MALRRMFSLEVVNTDGFQDMPPTAQNLYFHLGMRADDDGFVAAPKRVASNVRSKAKDLDLLEQQGLIIRFPTGPCVISHWKMNNYLQKDRYKETAFREEKSRLMTDDVGVYRLDTECIQDVSGLDTQDRIGKVRSGKERGENGQATAAPAQRSVRSRYGWVLLSDPEYQRLLRDLGETELQRCIDYVDESAQATGNKNKWKDWNLVLRRCHRDRWGQKKLPQKEPAVLPDAAGYEDEDAFI